MELHFAWPTQRDSHARTLSNVNNFHTHTRAERPCLTWRPMSYAFPHPPSRPVARLFPLFSLITEKARQRPKSGLKWTFLNLSRQSHCWPQTWGDPASVSVRNDSCTPSQPTKQNYQGCYPDLWRFCTWQFQYFKIALQGLWMKVRGLAGEKWVSRLHSTLLAKDSAASRKQANLRAGATFTYTEA